MDKTFVCNIVIFLTVQIIILQDCPDGIDEQNCTHLQQFTMTPNHRLYKHEIEKWLNTNVQTCAGYCLNSKSFACKSFNFK